MTDIITEDLQGDRVLLKNDYEYLDRTFRVTLDMFLACSYENSRVKKGDEIFTPPGVPDESYKQLGLESRIDLTVYNNFHQFIFTPYINYFRQNDVYLQNLLRGTLVYNLNLNPFLRPYHKTQVDSVLYEAQNSRPVIMRETVGAEAEYKNQRFSLSGRIGTGFEKQIHDPVRNFFYGLEGMAKVTVYFFTYLSYAMTLDSFFSTDRLASFEKSRGLVRSEFVNALSINFNRTVSLSLKHKWFYLYSGEYRERYDYSQIVTSLDFRTDFKM